MIKPGTLKTLLFGLFFSFIVGSVWGQTVLYSTDFESGSDVTFPTGWSGPTNGEWYIEAGAISEISPSSGYSGASGGDFLLATDQFVGDHSMIYSSISTVGYTNITVNWGAYKENSVSVPLSFAWRESGGAWNVLAVPDITSIKSWERISDILLPSGAENLSQLEIRITYTGTTDNFNFYALDDFIVTGTLSSGGTFYSKSSGFLNDLNTWGRNADGSGANPTSFSEDNLQLIISNNTNSTINGDWNINGSGSNIIVGDGSNNIIFTIPSTYLVSGQISIENNAELVISNSTYTPNFNSLEIGSTVTYNFSGAQNVLPFNYHNLKIYSGGTKTVPSTGNLTINGNLDIESGTVLVLPGSGFSSRTTTLNGNISGLGTISVSSTRTTLVIGGSGTFGTIYFTPAANNLRILTINRASELIRIGNNLNISNTLNLNSGTLDINNNTLTINGGLTTISGNIAGTSSSNLVINGTGNASLTFASGSRVLNNLTINRASSSITLASDLEVAGTLTLSNGTFAVGNYNLRLSGNPISGTPTNLSTTSSSNLIFSGSASSVFIPSSVTELNNLTLNNANGLQQNAASLTINGVMTLTSGTFDIQSNELYLLSNPSLSSGTLNASAGTVYYNQPTDNQNVIAGAYANLVLNDNIKFFPNSLVNISGTFTPGTASHNMGSAGEIEFSGTGPQTVPDLTYHDLTFSSTGSRNMSSASISGDFITGGNPVTISGTIDYNGNDNQTIAALNYNTLILSGNKSGRVVTLASGTIGVNQSFDNIASGTPTIVTTGNTFEYNGTGNQTITPFNYNDLSLTEARAGGSVITLGSGIIRVAGNFTNTTGVTDYTVTGNTFEYNGTATQSVATLEYNNLTINNSAGCNLTGDITVNSTLALTTGILNINTYTLRLLNGTTLGTGSIASSNTGTVQFAQADGTQSILLGNYGNLTTEGGTKSFSAGVVNISNTFTASAVEHTFSSSGAGSTINFNGAGTTQTIPSLNYFNLSLSNGGIYNFSGTIGIAGNFAVSGSNTYNTSGSTFIFNGAGNQDIAGINYNNLTVTDRTGTVTLVGTMSISGIFSAANTTTVYEEGTSSVTFNGSSVQNIPDVDFYNLTIDNPAGALLTNDIIVNHFLVLNEGALTIGDNSLTVNDAITYGTSGNLTGNLTGAILNLYGVDNTNIAAIDLYQLNIDRVGNTITLTGNLNVANQLQIANGTLAVGSNDVSVANSLVNNGTFNTGNGTVTFTGATVISGSNNITFNHVATNGTLSSITGTNSPIYVTGNWTNNSTNNATIGVEVRFNGTGSQTIISSNSNPSVQSFSNVFIENTGTKTLGSNFNVDGSLNLISGTFETGGFNLNLAGSWNNTGTTFTAGSGTVILDGDAGQTITSNTQSFNNLTITPTGIESVAITDALDINGNFTINDGTSFATNDFDINVAGNWQFNSGTLVSTFAAGTSIVYFDGADQNIAMPDESFYAVVMQGTGTKTITAANFTADNNIIVESGSIFSTSNSVATVNGDLSNAGTVNAGSGGIGLLDLGGNLDNSGSLTANTDITVAGNWNNQSTFTPNTYIVNLDGTSTQTITGGNFYGLTMSGSGSRILLSALDVDNDLTIESGISFSNYDGSANWYDINLAGDWVNDGSFTATAGTLITDGSVLQEIRGVSTTTFFDLTTTNTSVDGVRIEGSVDLVNTLKLEANTNFDADGASGSGVMRLLSNSSRTARVAKVEAGATLNGNLTTAHTLTKGSVGWYYLGTPVKSQTVAAWMDDMLIQGVDTRLPGSYNNIRLYDEPTGTWTALTSASDIINPGQGVRVTLYSSNFSTGSMTYDNRGVPVVGNNNDQTNTGGTEEFSFNLSYTAGGGGDEGAGWNLIANPYPGELSLDASYWTFNNVNSFAYIWDGENFTYDMVDMNSTSQSIASGQGFFVEVAGPSPSLTVNEDAKNASNPTFFRKKAPESELQIYALNKDGKEDVTYLRFYENATKGFDLHMDASKLDGGMFNISTMMDHDKDLAYNALPLLINDDSVKIRFKGVKGDYAFTFANMNSFNDKMAIYLKDKFLNQMVPVYDSFKYDFSITEDTASQGENRFELVFIRNFINLAGNVNDHNNNALENIELVIRDASLRDILINTNISGQYAVELERWKEYEVFPSFQAMNALSFSDIMATHLNSINKLSLNSAFAMIAADVNRDQKVDEEDVNAMKNIYIQKETDFEYGNWTFIDKNNFDPVNIWPLPTTAVISSDTDQQLNFLGIPTGNVMNVSTQNYFNESSEKVEILIEPNFAFSNDVLNLPVYIKNANGTLGYHFKIKWDTQKISFIECNNKFPGIEIQSEFAENGMLQVFYIDKTGEGITIEKINKIFDLRFIVNGAQGENVEFLIDDEEESFAIDNSLKKLDVVIASNSIVIGEANNNFNVIQNYPNPVINNNTRVIFSIPASGKVTLAIIDLNGKVLKFIEEEFQSGVNFLDLDVSNIKPGAYLYKVEFEESVISKKMIIK